MPELKRYPRPWRMHPDKYSPRQPAYSVVDGNCLIVATVYSKTVGRAILKAASQ